MIYFDKNPNVLKWASEEMFVPYKSPIDGRYHRYFPDFIIKIQNKAGEIETVMIEVKPFYQTQEPKKTNKGKLTKRYVNEVKTYAINRYKWDAAKYFCKKRNWKFKVLTEQDLKIKG